MTIRRRIGATLVALALAGVWTFPAPAAEVPAPAAEVPAAPAPDVVETAAPAPKVMKPRVVKPRVVKRFWRRHRPIRLVAAGWPAHASYRGGAHYLVLGVAY
jgi:hypothetical protein